MNPFNHVPLDDLNEDRERELNTAASLQNRLLHSSNSFKRAALRPNPRNISMMLKWIPFKENKDR